MTTYDDQLARTTLACLVLDRMYKVYADRGPELRVIHGEIVDGAGGTARRIDGRRRNHMAEDEPNQGLIGDRHQRDYFGVQEQLQEI